VPLVTLAAARANKTPIDWAMPADDHPGEPPHPVCAVQVHRPPRCSATSTWPRSPATSTGARSSRPGTWHGAFPAILKDEVVGAESVRVFIRRQAPAQARHRRPLAAPRTRWSAFLPANTVNDDDIEVYTDETRTEVAMHLAQPAPADRAKR
jgi:5-methyltetrahydrofolate--homocysteine methyltransferase